MDKIQKQSKITELIHSIDNKFQGIQCPEYLILIDESDLFEQCWVINSFYHVIRENSKSLFGNLVMMTFNEYKQSENNTKFKIAYDPQKYKLYKKLPVDNIYVTESDFILRNFTSVYSEFMNILSILNIKSVKINVRKETDCECNLFAPHTNVKDDISKKIQLNTNTEYSNKNVTAKQIIEMLNVKSKNFYYYHINEEWKQIIRRRLDGAINGKYYSEIVESHTNEAKLMAYFDFGCNVETNNTIICEYEFEYYPLEREI